ncbi:hypothetical protein [Synechococcus sp. UW140]|uniref:hypothetical protein n=1 Tax=Synechococcus sp. UW140 TaxID=368503 RepID=UPI000B71B0AB|nr:hypothetical protein [Synechococcus sp. UW140]OUW46615.1 MAG: hypothetical protein CBD47_05990 [Synechococcus sp. TMED187]
MTAPTSQRLRCELCQVEIDCSNGIDQVLFSLGGAGSRSKLWVRVCRYLSNDEQKASCINQDATKRGEEQPGDRYDEAPPLDLGRANGGS